MRMPSALRSAASNATARGERVPVDGSYIGTSRSGPVSSCTSQSCSCATFRHRRSAAEPEEEGRKVPPSATILGRLTSTVGDFSHRLGNRTDMNTELIRRELIEEDA